MEKEITEGNRLIAEFMGYEFKHDAPSLYPDGAFYKPNSKPEDFPELTMSMLEYHSSWDWLMPVVEKISEYEFDDGTEEHGQPRDTAFMRTFHNKMARINRFQLHEGKTQIEAVWLAVVDFIKWYNSQSEGTK